MLKIITIGAAITAAPFCLQAEQLDMVIPTFEECNKMINHELDLLNIALHENHSALNFGEFVMFQNGNDLMRDQVLVLKDNIDFTWHRINEQKEKQEY